MTENEAVMTSCSGIGMPFRRAFRRGFRWQRSGGVRGGNPYERHHLSEGWGHRFWSAWDEGWRVADAHRLVEEEVTNAGRS